MASDSYTQIKDDEVQTTIFMEIEGKIVHAVSRESVKQIESHMQAEHLIEVELNGVQIWIQSGNIEYLRQGDQRPKDDDNNNKQPEPFATEQIERPGI